MKHNPFYFFLVLLIILITPACWDTNDINNRAFILAMGIDKAQQNHSGQEEIPFKYKVTVEIAKPSLLKKNSWNLEPEKTAGIVLSAEGETIEKAIDLILTNISRPITFSHLRVLLVSEGIADNMQDICTYFEKHPEIARRLRLIFVQKKEAIDILKSTPRLERTIAADLIGMVEISRDFSLCTFKPFTKFLSEIRTNNGQTLGSVISLSNGEGLVRIGSAVFDDWKMVGVLDGEETRKASLLFPELKKTTFIGKFNNGTYTYKMDKKKTKIIPKIQNGNLNFLVRVNTDGIILQEEGNELYLADPKNIKKLERLFADVISKEVNEAIAKAQQELRVDYFNFGMKLMNKYPEYYNHLNWEITFPTVPISTEVTVKISRFGISK